METVCFSETPVPTYMSSRRRKAEDHYRHIHRCENLKFCDWLTYWLIDWMTDRLIGSLTAWNRVNIEKQMVVQTNSPPFMETEGSLPG
jgi:hypothetical protein